MQKKASKTSLLRMKNEVVTETTTAIEEQIERNPDMSKKSLGVNSKEV